MYKFGITCSLHTQRNQPVIYIDTKSMKLLQPNLLPFIHPSMKYKFYIYPSNSINSKK